jgi:hypothetical protein
VLAGVGGCTVAEAKERLTYEEALAWSAYMRKRGSLNVGMRLEHGFALLAAMINNALGGRAELRDFMPHAEPKQGTIEDVMTLLAGKK